MTRIVLQQIRFSKLKHYQLSYVPPEKTQVGLSAQGERQEWLQLCIQVTGLSSSSSPLPTPAFFLWGILVGFDLKRYWGKPCESRITEEMFALGSSRKHSPAVGYPLNHGYNLVTSCLAAAMSIDFHFGTIDFCFCSHLCLCFLDSHHMMSVGELSHRGQGAS